MTGSNAVSTVYIYSGGHVIAEYDNGAAVTTPTREYIYGSHLLASITGSTGGSGGTITYLHRDHLSPRFYTNSSGSCVGDQGTFPFGEPWYSNNDPKCTTSASSSWMFTTYERDAESTIDYALARSYYSSEGRFMSPDPVGGSPANPQTWNRYAYSGNDPINSSDPSGQDCFDGVNCSDSPTMNGSGQFMLNGVQGWNVTDNVQGFAYTTPSQWQDESGSISGTWGCSVGTCAFFPDALSSGTDASFSDTSSASGGQGSALGGMLGDNANIIQGLQIDHLRMLAAYSMSGYLGLALGRNPIGGFEEAIEGTATGVAARTFTSPDPLVADLANEIEALYPGHVQGVNVPFYDAAGQQLGDHDILLDNAVIQVKSGQGADGILIQLQRSEADTGLPSIGYAPRMRPNAIGAVSGQGGLITGDRTLLLQVIAP